MGQAHHEIAIATENPAERVFEALNFSRFPIEREDLTSIGIKLNTLGDGLSEDEMEEFLKSEGPW